MQPEPRDQSPLRILSIVEAVSITGPLKPLLLFSHFIRSDGRYRGVLQHYLLSTRRPAPLLNPADDEVRRAAEAAGLEFLAIPERRAFDVAVMPKLLRAIETVKPHIVETHACKSHFLFYALRAAHPALRRVKWIAFHHGYTRSSRRVIAYQQLDRLTLRSADHVVTFCKPFARDVTGRGVRVDHLTILANCADCGPPPSREAIDRIRSDLKIGPDECVVISIGRLSREKGQADLVRAFAKLLDAKVGVSARLMMVGDGPDRTELAQLAAPMGSRVVFSGHLQDPWVALNAAEIFSLPSHSEGSPLALLEAMSAGLPIVATRVGGVPELLTDGQDALLVNARDPDALCAAFIRLMGDGELRARLGRAAKETSTRFSLASYSARVLEIYRNVLRQGETV